MVSTGQKAKTTTTTTTTKTTKQKKVRKKTEKQNFLALGDLVSSSNKVFIESQILLFLPTERRHD